MTQDTTLQSWEVLKELAETGDSTALEKFMVKLGPNEAFRALLRLSPEQRESVLTTISPEQAANLFDEIPEEHAADFIEELQPKDAAQIIDEMGSDMQVDVLSEMKEEDVTAIVAEMDPEEATDVKQRINYPNDVAGGLMVTEYFAYPENATIGEVTADLNAHAEEENIGQESHIYVVSPRGKLVGVLDLRDLVLTRRNRPVADILKLPLYVDEYTSLDELDNFFDRHDFHAVPVIDKRNRLIGMVRRSDVTYAINARAEQDYLKSQGIIGGDEIRTLPVLTRCRRRLSWLSINIVLNIIAASVIAFYEDTLKAVIALAVFLPIVSDMSGCSGNQAVAVSMRELSLGIVKPFEVLRVWIQEISVGLINGAALGCLIGLVAFAWKGNAYLGLVVGCALAVNTVVAVSIGGTVPLLLKRFNVDPAVASGPILTTVTDMCGFFIILGFATLMLPYLSSI